MSTSLPVVVVGSGVSGLSSIKACLEEGLDVVCYEASDDIGGLWKFREKGTSVTDTTVLNSSKEFTAFSDFPVPDDFPNYMPHRKYLEYLRMYAKHFQLEKHVRFNRKVLHVDRGVDDNWKVNVDGEIVDASAVIMCGGIHSHYNPNIPGLRDKFKGEIIKSVDYRRPNGLEGKNVLIIGSANTAFDTAVEVAKVANKVYLSCSHVGTIIGRIRPDGYPMDFTMNRAAIWIFHQLFQLKLCNSIEFVKIINGMTSVGASAALYGLKPEGLNQFGPAVINDDIWLRVATGQVVIKDSVMAFTDNSVVFKGGEHVAVDVVIVAAGFVVTNNNLFDKSVLDDDQMVNGCYRQVFPVHLTQPRCSLAFLAKLKLNGPACMIIELQARWTARVFSGRTRLPSVAQMNKNLEFQIGEKLDFKIPRNKFKTMGIYPYVDDVAREFGAKPNLWVYFFTDIRLWWYLCFRQFISAQFRLQGPHSCPNARRNILISKSRIEVPFKTKTTSTNVPHSSCNRFRMWFWLFVAVCMTLVIFFLL